MRAKKYTQTQQVIDTLREQGYDRGLSLVILYLYIVSNDRVPEIENDHFDLDHLTTKLRACFEIQAKMKIISFLLGILLT
jgi:hypothetical protein